MDLITLTCIRKAIDKVKEEHGIIISEKEATEIVYSQSKGIQKAILNKETVKIDFLGKFMIKEGREELIQISKKAKELNLSGEERKEYFKEHKRLYDESKVFEFKQTITGKIDGNI